MRYLLLRCILFVPCFSTAYFKISCCNQCTYPCFPRVPFTNVLHCILPKTLFTFSPAQFSFNPFPNKPWFLRVCSTNLLKTQWEEEKLLVTSNFSFSHSVFCPFGTLSTIFIKYEIVVCKLFQLGQSEIMSFGKGLRH